MRLYLAIFSRRRSAATAPLLSNGVVSAVKMPFSFMKTFSLEDNFMMAQPLSGLQAESDAVLIGFVLWELQASAWTFLRTCFQLVQRPPSGEHTRLSEMSS